MDSRPPSSPRPPLADAIAAAQAWWRDAGVDLDYSDEPHGWLSEPERERESEPAPRPVSFTIPAPSPEPAIGGDRADWPQDLARFHEWWLTERTLDPGGTAPRVAPRGEQGAAVMMLVPMPEEDDREVLLQGAQGRLLASLTAAMGLGERSVYFGAALPRQMPMPDWNGLAARGYGDILLHHIGLANPARLIVFGRDVLSLLGHDPAQSAPFVSQIAIQGRQLPLLATYAPGRLLGSSRWRAQLWRCWLDWTEGDLD